MEFEHRAMTILADAYDEYQPSHVFALFSGGHDSLCVTHLAARFPKFSGAVHINTGIGIEQTRQFVRDQCALHCWPLLEYHPPGLTYRDYVLKFGFPGPGHHTFVYRWLKERCIEQLVRDHKRDRMDRILLVTGVRASESRRRMGTAAEITKKGAQIWAAPIVHWGEDEKHAYMEAHDLSENQVVRLLCMSGECLCGAFARPNEIAEIELWFPEAAQKIRDLEKEAAAAGTHAIWGTRPPRAADRNQIDLPLCFSCQAKEDRYGNEEDQPNKTREDRHQESDARA